ncbi:MAG: ATPase [Pseudomonadota bacterium]
MSNAPRIAPPLAPIRLDALGLNPTTLRDLLLKTVFRTNAETVTAMAEASCAAKPIIEDLVERMRGEALIETLGNRGASSASELRYQLTDAGRNRAREALAQSSYFGAFPVTLEAFTAQCEAQSIRKTVISREALAAAAKGLILPQGLLDTLGPAVNSGRSILFYGPPGNGKSVISNMIRDAIGDHVYIPRVLDISGQIITVFDPVIHRAVEEPDPLPNALRQQAAHDPRYVRCRRPTVTTGGELTLDMLDLGYSAESRIYQASLQMKATGGVFIVDDLGRQRESPQALMNRWIVPIEQRFDLLSLNSGQKFTVPFDTLVIFSTNFAPKSLFDGAALRRIYYKIQIDGPSRDDFVRIFAQTAQRYRMPPREDVLAHLLQTLYPRERASFAAFHAPFLIDQMASICAYEGVEPHMSVPLVERAWANLFVKDAEDTL